MGMTVGVDLASADGALLDLQSTPGRLLALPCILRRLLSLIRGLAMAAHAQW